MVVGGAMRLWHIGQPHEFVFDETYYAKDALGLLRFGSEQGTVEDANEILLHSRPDAWSADVFTGAPSFIVHPPFGKWLIGMGELAFGVTPTGWRIAAVLFSTLSILVLGRVVLRLTSNPLLATIAAFLLALEGLHLVIGRVGVLDGFLMFFVLAAFAALLIDRDRARDRYLASGPPVGLHPWRGWRIVAGVLLGLGCAVKWNALWYVAAFGLLTVAWEIGNRRRAGAARPWRSTLLTDALPAFICIVVVGAAVYLLSWTGWLVTDSGWSRDWQQAADPGVVSQALGALWQYHADIYRFHVGLQQPHAYQAPAWGWLVLARPTSFFYNGDGVGCGAGNCSAAVTALGNPLIWWPAVLALVHQTYRAVMVRDGRSAAVVVGVLAGWVPWLFYPERTMFFFYAVVFVPFLVAALTLSIGQVLGTGEVAARRWRIGLVGAYLLAVVIAAWWFFPVWTGQEIPYGAWRLRMWLPTWV